MNHKITDSKDIYKLLEALVAIHSVSPNENKLGNYISEYLRNLGFVIQLVPTGLGRNNIVATFGLSNKYLGFYGHLDTVMPDRNYSSDPYTIWGTGDMVHGLGVADMKGGISAILELAKIASAKNMPVKIILGVDEENISAGAHDLINSKKLKDIDFLISAENGQVKDLNEPYSVCYGRRGRLALRIKIAGKKAHAAEYYKAMNAIEKASVLLINLNKINFSDNTKFGTTNLVVHEINGSTDSFSVPDECTFIISALTTPPTTHKTVVSKLKILAKNLNVSATIEPLPRATPYSESYKVKQTKFLHTIESKVFNSDRVRPIYSESVADENIFANKLGIPVLSIGPIGGGDHTKDEWVSLSSIEKVLDCYQKILGLYFAVEE